MKRIDIATFVLFLALPLAGFAQGSGTMNPPRPNTSGRDAVSEDASGRRPFMVTQSAKVRILDVNADQHLLVVEDEKGERHELKVDSKTKFKADKKTELAEKKNLSVADFRSGQTVKVTFRGSDSTATEIRLRR